MTAAAETGWILARSRVRLAGHILGAGTATPGALPVVLTAVRARRGSGATGPTYQAHLRPDGRYFLLDLPPGRYALAGRDERRQAIGPLEVTIPPGEGLGHSRIVILDLRASAPADVPEVDAPARRRRATKGGR
jgi:hypothetical protein